MPYSWPLGLLASVVLTFFSYPPYALGPVMFVALVPLFRALDEAPSVRAAFFRCWCYVFVGNFAICFWVAQTVQRFAHLPWIVGVGAVALLSAFEQLAWPVMAAIRHLVIQRVGRRPWLWTPIVLVLLDMTIPKIFPDTMGVVFYRIGFLRQLADLGGIWTLTGLLVMTNEVGAAIWRQGWQATKREAVVAGCVLLLALAYGGWRQVRVARWMEERMDTLRFAVIQSNVNAYDELSHTFLKDAARVQLAAPLFERSYAALADKPDLVVWPETAIANTYHSDNPSEYRPLTEAVDKFLNGGVPLLFGARDRRGDNLYNAAFLVDKGEPQVYRKVHLLAWGEWIPFAEWMAWRKIAVALGATPFEAGRGPQLVRLGHYQLGPYICFEALFPWYIRQIALSGADVLVNLTNDAWFGEGGGPELHFALSRFRAVETRRPIVRVATSGYSALVDIDGTVRQSTQLARAETLNVAVPVYSPHSSPFLRIGPWLVVLAVIWVIVAPILCAFAV